MKTNSLPFLLLLCIGLLSWSACGDDDDIVQDSLNYDGPNFTAPQNAAGFNTFAAYFPSSVTQPFIGRDLVSVRFWLQDIPLSTTVIIYDVDPNGDDRQPGPILYSRDITQRINATGWIDHNLTTPVELTGAGLWIGIETEIAQNLGQAIGCDQGTNYNPNGDRFQDPSGAWTSFNEVTGTERINWNIRGFLNEQ
ncbi:MAG: hypothetical protein AAGA31_05125 [Bacteroidota bacterium]